MGRDIVWGEMGRHFAQMREDLLPLKMWGRILWIPGRETEKKSTFPFPAILHQEIEGKKPEKGSKNKRKCWFIYYFFKKMEVQEMALYSPATHNQKEKGNTWLFQVRLTFSHAFHCFWVSSSRWPPALRRMAAFWLLTWFIWAPPDQILEFMTNIPGSLSSAIPSLCYGTQARLLSVANILLPDLQPLVYVLSLFMLPCWIDLQLS